MAGLGVIGSVEFARDRQREKLRNEHRLLCIIAAAICNGDSTGLESNIRNGSGDLVASRVNDRDAVRARIRDVQFAATRRQCQPIGLGADRNSSPDRSVERVSGVQRQNRDGAAHGISDISARTIGGQRHAVRLRSNAYFG